MRWTRALRFALLLSLVAAESSAENLPHVHYTNGNLWPPFGTAGRSGNAPSPAARKAAADTFDVVALLVAFPPDSDRTTTGNGTFGDVLDANEVVYGGVYPELFDIPRDAAYFREQLRYLAQYYRKVSYGALEIVTTVPDTIFVAAEPMAYYGENEEADHWQSALLAEVVALADSLVDFGAHDGVVVFHAGAGEETDVLGDSPGDIWTAYLGPGDLAAALADSGKEDAYRGIATADRTSLGDTVFVTEGILLPESESQDTIGGTAFAQWTLGVSAHMFGRLLGGPSLFDTDDADGSSSQGVGNFGILGTGLWNSGGILPPHPCAWTKIFFGWVQPLLVTADTTITLPPVEREDTEPKILQIPISETEYFLVENRYKDENGNGVFDFDDPDTNNVLLPFVDSYEGAEFDWSLPEEGNLEGSGILIWHIDEGKIPPSGDFTRQNDVNADPDRKGVDLEEADGIQDLDMRATSLENFGGAGDSWRVGNRNRFDGSSVPSSSASFGAATGIAIEVESTAGSLMTVTVTFSGRVAGWPVRTGAPVVLVGPVVPVYGSADDRVGFAYAYTDTASGESFGSVLGLRGKAWDGWPVELPGEASYGPVAFAAAADGPIALYFPLADGSIAKFGTGGEADTTGVWDEPIPGASGQMLSSAAPEGPVLALISGGGGTTLFRYDPSGVSRDSIARVGGLPVAPAAIGPPVIVATDSGGVYRVVVGDAGAAWRIATESEPSAPVVALYTPPEGEKEGVVRSLVAFTEGDLLHIRDGATGVSLPAGPVLLPAPAAGEPALADLDDDGSPEVIVGTADGAIRVFNRTGAPSTGWPFHITGGPGSEPSDRLAGAPAVGDIDGDGSVEVLFGSAHGSLWIVGGDASVAGGSPRAVPGISSSGMLLGARSDAAGAWALAPSPAGSFDLFLAGEGEPRVDWTGFGNGSGLRGSYAAAPAAPDGGEELLVEAETFCYPNPVGPGGGARIHYRLTRRALLTVEIYTVAGTLVEEFPPREVPAETGEMIWETGGVGSGVYVARVEARSGGTRERKFLHIAITR